MLARSCPPTQTHKPTRYFSKFTGIEIRENIKRRRKKFFERKGRRGGKSEELKELKKHTKNIRIPSLLFGFYIYKMF